jgi:hypothetical protein
LDVEESANSIDDQRMKIRAALCVALRGCLMREVIHGFRFDR